jgi:Asp/Glu/hydantoin racemase
MKLLVVNPNITESVSQLIGAEAKRGASPGTDITMLTAPFGVAYIETRLEALIGAYASLVAVAENLKGHDAVVIAAFGDPGVAGIREALEVPVVGMTEAALASASLLGQRFSIVAISKRIAPWYRETVEHYGFAGRLASIRSLDRPLRDIGNVQGEHTAALKEACMSCIENDGADVIILAGGPLAGLARAIAGEIPVPVVDGVSSAVRHAETLVALKPGVARSGSFAAPPSKPNAGLPPAIAELLRRRAAE